MKFIKLATLCAFITLSSCSLAPTYHRPEMDIPAGYKESGTWLPAKPVRATLDRGEWWRMYQDPVLDALEPQVCVGNQNLKAALARYQEARAAAAVARAALFPTGIAVGNASRQQASGSVANKDSVPLYSDFLLSFDLSYEVDLWGRVRNTVAAANARAHASAADAASINLSLQAELANDYFLIREVDTAQDIYDKTEKAYKKALTLTHNLFQGGAAPIGDYDQAQSQYENAKTLATDNRLKRAQLEHAIAILIGQAPDHFSLQPALKKFHLVTIEPYLPSTLLERRPDVAAAELRVEAANADIGVARAAYFPQINLSTGLGLESAVLSNLFKAPSRIWALGPSSIQAINSSGLPLADYTIFDGGKMSALTTEAWAAYHENVALYRQTVLNALQEVEDNLVAVRRLDQENKSQTLATSAADRALAQAFYRYQDGLTTYLDVVVIQNIALQSELAAVAVKTRRQVASVLLIKALGGGWQEHFPL